MFLWQKLALDTIYFKNILLYLKFTCPFLQLYPYTVLMQLFNIFPLAAYESDKTEI